MSVDGTCCGAHASVQKRTVYKAVTILTLPKYRGRGARSTRIGAPRARPVASGGRGGGASRDDGPPRERRVLVSTQSACRRPDACRCVLLRPRPRPPAPHPPRGAPRDFGLRPSRHRRASRRKGCDLQTVHGTGRTPSHAGRATGTQCPANARTRVRHTYAREHVKTTQSINASGRRHHTAPEEGPWSRSRRPGSPPPAISHRPASPPPKREAWLPPLTCA